MITFALGLFLLLVWFGRSFGGKLLGSEIVENLAGKECKKKEKAGACLIFKFNNSLWIIESWQIQCSQSTLPSREKYFISAPYTEHRQTLSRDAAWNSSVSRISKVHKSIVFWMAMFVFNFPFRFFFFSWRKVSQPYPYLLLPLVARVWVKTKLRT